MAKVSTALAYMPPGEGGGRDAAGDVSLVVTPDIASFMLVIAVRGCGEVAGEARLTPACAALFSRDTAEIAWAPGSDWVAIRCSRATIQAQASAVHGGARRLVRGVLPVAVPDGRSALRWATEGGSRGDAPPPGMMKLLVEQHGLDAVFPLSRAATFARAELDRGAAGGDCNLDDLARRAGVTATTLQRGFRDCIGTTVAAYAKMVRLREARGWLVDLRESRPIAAIAIAAGFTSAGRFTHAYRKLFGETPTETRSKAVRFDGIHVLK